MSPAKKPKGKAGRPVAITLGELVLGPMGKQGTKQLSVRELLSRLGSIMCTTKEVAACLGISEPTLFALFKREPEARKLYEEGKLSGVASLRRAQFALAEKNATMGIFLGMNYAGQKDRREFTGKDGKNLFPGDIDIKDLTTEQLIEFKKRLRGAG